MHNSQLKFSEFYQQIKNLLLHDNLTISILLSLTFFNWFFEIWKWKTLSNTIRNTSFIEATKQSLAALTTSLFTPNRIGDYGAKALYFPRNKWKAMALNLLGNLYQLTATILFGIVGLIFFIKTFDVEINPHRIHGIAYLFGFLMLYFIPNKNREVKLFTYLKLDKLRGFVKKITLKIHLKIIIFSLFRYIIFSFQFYFLLRIFGLEVDSLTLLYLIYTMYIIASFIPSISLFDWAVKGSVAIYVFSFIDVSDITIITITLLMWVLNFAIPAILGSLFVMNFKFQKE